MRVPNSLIGAVNVVNGQNSQVAVVTEIAQGNAGASLELVVVDDLLGHVEGNGHGEDMTIGQTAVLANAGPVISGLFGDEMLFQSHHRPGFLAVAWYRGIPVIVGLVHETCSKIGISKLHSVDHPSVHLRPRCAIKTITTPQGGIEGSIVTNGSMGRELTLQGREATVHDQLEITQLALGEDNGGEGLRLDGELVVAGSITGNQVLEDTTVRSVGHDVIWRNEKEGGIGKLRKDQNKKGLLELARGILYNGKREQKRWEEEK